MDILPLEFGKACLRLLVTISLIISPRGMAVSILNVTSNISVMSLMLLESSEYVEKS